MAEFNPTITVVTDSIRGQISITYLTGPSVSIIFFGDGVQRRQPYDFHMSHRRYGADAVKGFYEDILGGRNLGLLDRDLVIDLMKYHFPKKSS